MKNVIVLLTVCVICLTAFTGCKKSEPEKAGMPDMDAAVAKVGEAASAMEQTMCPVMGGKIDKDIFVEYKGQKVYFCCKACVAKFQEAPEQYMAKLPQFK